MVDNTIFEVFGYRTSSRFASHLKVSVDSQTVSVTGPRVGVTIYRLWMVLQAVLLALTVPTLIVAIVLWDWRYLVTALALLFFFLNHIIESTVLPLELIFEHRNYLPAMFLFLPIAAGLQGLYDNCAFKKRPVMAGALAGLLAAFAGQPLRLVGRDRRN